MDVVDTPKPSLLHRILGTPGALLGWAWASLLANCALVVTGAVVRLTDSGLGCDTWPRCNGRDYTAKPAMGYHSYIEFGNRLLTFVLIAVAAATLVAAVRSRASQKVRTLTILLLVGLPFQGVIGGITVLMKLNPWVVALHLLLSIVLIVWCVQLILLVRGEAPEHLPTGERRLVQVLFWVLMLAIWLGTVVTGSGPNAGDHGAKRNGLDILWVARFHAEVVWLAVLLCLVLLWRLRRLGRQRAFRWAGYLMGAMLLQGAIGYAQYFSGLPLSLVICHMAGLTLVTSVVSWLWYGTRTTTSGATATAA